MNIVRLLKKLYYYPGPTLNTAARRNIDSLNRLLADYDRPVALNLGSGQRFLGGAGLDKNRCRLFNMDILPLSTVDVVADAHSLPFSDGVFAAVICQAVLEHVRHPERVVSEMQRVLKRDGIVYVEVPFLQGFHPAPHDFFRFTQEGLEAVFAGFKKIEAGVCVGPASTMCLVAREFLSGLLSGFSGKRTLRRISDFIAGWLTFPIKYLDLMLARRAGAGRIAAGIYFIGRKE